MSHHRSRFEHPSPGSFLHNKHLRCSEGERLHSNRLSPAGPDLLDEVMDAGLDRWRLEVQEQEMFEELEVLEGSLVLADRRTRDLLAEQNLELRAKEVHIERLREERSTSEAARPFSATSSAPSDDFLWWESPRLPLRQRRVTLSLVSPSCCSELGSRSPSGSWVRSRTLGWSSLTPLPGSWSRSLLLARPLRRSPLLT